jgi:hypothetical protein
MTTITAEQRQQIEHEGHTRIEGGAYVVLKAEVYDRLRRLLEDDGPDMHQVAALVERAMREEDAGDPLLESYQRYRP